MTMLEQLRENIREALARRSAVQDQVDAAVSAAEARDDGNLTEDETRALTEGRAQLVTIDDEVVALRAREADLVDLADRRSAADRLAEAYPAPTGGGGAPATVRVGAEPMTYRQGGPHNFLCDAYAARHMGDRNAADRIERNNAEMTLELRGDGVEVRDVGTSAYGALVVPQYLVDLVAPKKRAGRPFADSVRDIPLTDEGMVANIPRITTGTDTAVQATENSAVQETDMDETTLAVNVRTIAGQQDVSRQALERGRLVEQITVGDLVAAYHNRLDNQIINADGTSGTHLGVLSTVGINAVTYTDASPTVPELTPKIADAIQQVNSTNFGDAGLIVMHPRRWGWLTAAVDTAGRPLVPPVPNGPMNASGVVEFPGVYGKVVGTLQGLPVITDANIPTNLGAGTNEDRIIVLDPFETILMEDGGKGQDPLYLRFEETTGGSLTVKLVVYAYSAFTAGRYPASISVIAGTGLVTPTF